MSKINPGSNRNEDNDLAIATHGMSSVDIPEPKILENGKIQCPACVRTFSSKEDYISHALVRHQMPMEVQAEAASMIPTNKEPLLSKNRNDMAFSAVHYEKGFHFYTDIGKYTGVTALSLQDFVEKLKDVPGDSVTFHFQRRDFQRWITDVFGNDELSQKIDEIQESPGSSSEGLRKDLSETVKNDIG